MLGEEGLYRLHSGTKIGRAVDVPGIHAITVKDGTLWAADAGRVGYLSNGAFVPQSERFVDAPISNILVDAEDTIYAATETEIFTLRRIDGEFVATQRHAGFNHIIRLFVDRERTLWLSSESGLIRALGDRFAHYPLRTENDPQMVWASLKIPKGRFGLRRSAACCVKRATC